MHDRLVKLVESAMHEMYHLPNFPDQLRQEISKMKAQVQGIEKALAVMKSSE
jgi:hypothetical protein